MERNSRSSSVTLNGMVLEEVLQGIVQCRKLEENAKIGFRSLEEIIRAQGDAIKSLEKTIQMRPTQDDVFRIARESTGVDEIKVKIDELQASSSETAAMCNAKLESLKKSINKETQKQSDGIEWLSRGFDLQKTEIKDVKQMQTNSNTDLKNTLDLLTKTVGKIESEICEILKQQASSKIEISTCKEHRETMRTMLDRIQRDGQEENTKMNVKIGEIDSKFKCLKDDTNSDCENMAKELKDTSVTCHRRINQVQISVDELQRALPALEQQVCRTKNDLAQKPDTAEVATKEETMEIIVDHRGHVAQLLERTASRRDLDCVNQNLGFLVEEIGALKGCLKAKAELQDLEKKPNTSDVNEVLRNVGQALDQTANRQEIEPRLETISNYQSMLSSCFGEMGRWQWSGQLKSAGSVPWDFECMNTCPENFVWKSPKASVMCVRGGVYKATATFFSSRCPVIHLLINGQPVSSTTGMSRKVAPQAKGNVLVGVTCEELVLLLPKSRIVVRIEGDQPVEGFLTLWCMDHKL